MDYIKKDNAKYAEAFSFELEMCCYLLQGGLTIQQIGFPHSGYDKNLVGCMTRRYSCICLNRGMGNSMSFEGAYDPERHDLMITFCRLPSRMWTIGFYTTHDYVDCSEIAKYFGGGGHRRAAGCQLKELPF